MWKKSATSRPTKQPARVGRELSDQELDAVTGGGGYISHSVSRYVATILARVNVCGRSTTPDRISGGGTGDLRGDNVDNLLGGSGNDNLNGGRAVYN